MVSPSDVIELWLGSVGYAVVRFWVLTKFEVCSISNEGKRSLGWFCAFFLSFFFLFLHTCSKGEWSVGLAKGPAGRGPSSTPHPKKVETLAPDQSVSGLLWGPFTISSQDWRVVWLTVLSHMPNRETPSWVSTPLPAASNGQCPWRSHINSLQNNTLYKLNCDRVRFKDCWWFYQL